MFKFRLYLICFIAVFVLLRLFVLVVVNNFEDIFASVVIICVVLCCYFFCLFVRERFF
jgi:hypothetical protein